MPKSVLIIDDEPAVTAALMVRLQAGGYSVFHAINGLAGVEAAALHEPDLIILDIRMPDIDGYDACVRIKRLPHLKRTPVIFLSAHAQEASRRRAMDVGGSLFMSKPYVAGDVIRAIEALTRVANSGAPELASPTRGEV